MMLAGTGKLLTCFALIIIFASLLLQSPVVLMIFKSFIEPVLNIFKFNPSLRKMSSATGIKLLGQQEAIKIDEELFNEYKFSVDQLMELAGLSVASVIHRLYSQSHSNSRILVIAGPGNNGGDGMVAARHLKLFGFSDITLLNTRKPTKDLFINLIHQAEQTGVDISYDPFLKDESVGLIVDGLFGFSFKPPVRPDFQPFMSILTSASKSIPIISIDIPSGWDVENGPPENDNSMNFMPETLISLTAPKKCASFFKGRYHYLGGRFVPNKLAEKYALNLPPYQGTECILKL